MADFTEANRKYFDQLATAYKDRYANVMTIISEGTLNHRSWISDRWTDTEVGKGKEIKMLEYACGPGIISITLAPYLTKVVGFDVSDNMVNEYNRNAESLGFSDRMVAFKADLLAERVPEEYSGSDFYNLDIVTISMSLHHFEHPGLALQRLAPRLKKGGVCYIIDFVPSPGHGHGHAHSPNQGPGDGHDHRGQHDHDHKHHHDHDHDHKHGPGHGDKGEPAQDPGDQPGHGHGNEFGDATHTVKTHGFSKEDMQKLFESAGLSVGFDYQELLDPLVFNKENTTFSKTAFVARAQRA